MSECTCAAVFRKYSPYRNSSSNTAIARTCRHQADHDTLSLLYGLFYHSARCAHLIFGRSNINDECVLESAQQFDISNLQSGTCASCVFLREYVPWKPGWAVRRCAGKQTKRQVSRTLGQGLSRVLHVRSSLVSAVCNCNIICLHMYIYRYTYTYVYICVYIYNAMWRERERTHVKQSEYTS